MTETLTSPQSQPSLGALLISLRQARGLTLEEVSQRLRFSVRQIHLLESGEFDALPDMAVVRAMTRAYARLLEADVPVLIRQLELERPDAQRLAINASTVSVVPQGVASFTPNLSPTRHWVLAALLVLFLAALVALFWRGAEVPQPVGDLPVPTTVVPAPDTAISAPATANKDQPPVTPATANNELPPVTPATAIPAPATVNKEQPPVKSDTADGSVKSSPPGGNEHISAVHAPDALSSSPKPPASTRPRHGSGTGNFLSHPDPAASAIPPGDARSAPGSFPSGGKPGDDPDARQSGANAPLPLDHAPSTGAPTP